MTELKIKLNDGSFQTIEFDIEHGVEIIGIEPEQPWSLYTESDNGSESQDFVGEKSTREEER